jgi:hypothetical protein
MEHIVTHHIMKHADKHGILYKLQHGFRSGLSCETQLIEFVNDILINMDKKQQTDVVIMDFAKAFDKVGQCTKWTDMAFVANFIDGFDLFLTTDHSGLSSMEKSPIQLMYYQASPRDQS